MRAENQCAFGSATDVAAMKSIASPTLSGLREAILSSPVG
jgi:hypothetical protein